MKIIHFTLGKVNPNSSNGVNKVIQGLSKYLNKIENVEVQVLTLKKDLKDNIKYFERDGFKVISFKSFFKLLYYLISHRKEYDIIHLHTAWSISNLIVFYFSKLLKKQSILTVHGSLSKDLIKRRNYFLKKIFHKLFQKKYFDNLNAIHCLSNEELNEIKEYTNNKKIYTISNGIDIEELNENLISTQSKIMSKKIIFGSIGRLSVEKNYSSLLYAIKLLDDDIKNKIEVHIIGKIDQYGKELIELAKTLKLSKIVKFLDELYGKDKWERLSLFDFYIQCSKTEVGGNISIREAMYFSKPLILSSSCKIQDIKNENFVIISDTTPKSISNCIIKAINNYNSYKKQGKEAHIFASKIYNWEKISLQMFGIYKFLLNK